MPESQATADYYKFCPGEQHVRISNAICLGRRRTHYPKCHGCQFNDDEKTVAAPKPASSAVTEHKTNSLLLPTPPDRTLAANAVSSLFRPFDVFGTVPEPLSRGAAWRIGHATAQFLRSKLRGCDRADPSARAIVVGRDPREHSTMLEEALIEGIRSTGTNVVSLGLVDAAQVYFAVNRLGACGGVQITAGHRPIDQNGFQICGTRAAPIGVETGLISIRDIAMRIPEHQTGVHSRLLTKDLSEPYTQFIREFLFAKSRLPHPVKIVVDAGNGSAGHWLPIVLKGIRNLRIVRLNFECRGEFAHEPNPMKLRNTRELRKIVKDEQADFGVCLDSSAERCVFTDDKGRTCRPEFLGTLLARLFIEREPGATIIYDHRSSAVTEEEIVRAGGVAVRERIGGDYVKRAMAERNAVFGCDLSGRFYFRDNYYCESGILAMVQVINLLLSTRRDLSELIRPLQRYSSSGDVSFTCDDTDMALHQIVQAHGSATVEQFDGVTFRYPDWWFNVRPFASQRLVHVTLEARSRKIVDQKLTELQPLLGERT